MSWKYVGRNYRSFSALCQNGYGRKIIKTDKNVITKDNIAEELSKALVIHQQNAMEIDYLDRYYRGDQPILYRKKEVRPEVNNKIVENIAYMIVETKTAEIVGEPIQYVLRGVDEEKSKQINELNMMMSEEDKHHYDIELKRWSSICGTSYRFIGNDNSKGRLLDKSPFFISTEDPRYTFVAYYQDMRPAFSCQIRKDDEGREIYNCYTDKYYFLIQDNELKEVKPNGNRAIPVIEYPNNSRRLSDIEITISITDALNTMSSDRVNGIEQFVSSWVKFINCEVDSESFLAMRREGALVVKSNNGSDNKADVDVMTSELNQTESQVAVGDLYDKMLMIHGMASRQKNSGGDTAGAVELRNGHYDAEKRAELSEPIFKKAERDSLRIILNKLRVSNGFDLSASDIDIHISRSKMENALTKAEVLKILLEIGIEESIAIKIVGLFPDAEGAYLASKQRFDILYPKEKTEEVVKDGAE